MRDPESFAAPSEVRKLRGEGLLTLSSSSCRLRKAMGVKMLVSSVLLATAAAKLVITVEGNGDEDQLAKILLAVSMLLATWRATCCESGVLRGVLKGPRIHQR